MWWARHSQRRAEPAPHAEARKPRITGPHDSGDPPAGWPPSQPLLCNACHPHGQPAPLPSRGSQDAASGRNTDGKEATCPWPLGGRAPTFPHTGARPTEARVLDPHGTPPPSPGGAAPTREPGHGRPRGSKDRAPDDVSSSTRAKACRRPLTQACRKHAPLPAQRPADLEPPTCLASAAVTEARALPEAAGPAVQQQRVGG